MEQGSISTVPRKTWALCIYFHFRSGIGLRMTTFPARFLDVFRACSARFWPVVLVSDRISRVLPLLSAAGCRALIFSRAWLKSVPRP